jgi:hypothetical protein
MLVRDAAGTHGSMRRIATARTNRLLTSHIIERRHRTRRVGVLWPRSVRGRSAQIAGSGRVRSTRDFVGYRRHDAVDDRSNRVVMAHP